eukprot:89682-Ditylum_brightwellii.AAC.1
MIEVWAAVDEQMGDEMDKLFELVDEAGVCTKLDVDKIGILVACGGGDCAGTCTEGNNYVGSIALSLSACECCEQ